MHIKKPPALYTVRRQKNRVEASRPDFYKIFTVIATSSASYSSGYTNGRGYFKTFSISAKGSQTATTNISITGCSNYQALSASNIKVGVTDVSANDHSWVSWGIGVAVAGYNPNSGIVTVQVRSSESTESVIKFNGFAAVVK